MIENITVLQESFVPRGELFLHRHRELERLASAFKPLESGRSGETVVLYGPPGTGKTTTAKAAVEQLSEAVPEVATAYIDTWQNSQRGSVLHSLVDDLLRAPDIQRRSTPQEEIYERLREFDRQSVLVMDEVDQLANEGILRDVYELPNLTPVLVANRESDLYSGLEPRIRSRLSVGVKIKFERYSDTEVFDILQKRAEHGLRPGSISRDQLQRIATSANGDARRAIVTLRVAARDSAEEDSSSIAEEIVSGAIEHETVTVRQKSISRLDRHQRVLYEVIKQSGRIAPSKVTEKYRERVQQEIDEEPRAERTIRKYLNEMQEYNLIQSSGASHNRRYSAVKS